jgi:hypothetical protein
VLKGIAGQSIFQLAVMYALVFHGDSIFGVPNGSLTAGPSEHYTLVFNAFVLLQLFNQVCLPPALPSRNGTICSFGMRFRRTRPKNEREQEKGGGERICKL